MTHRHRFQSAVIGAFFATTIAALLPAQDGDKKALSIDDYAKWRTVGGTLISAKGDWTAFSYRQRETDEELHIQQLDGDKKYEVKRGSSPSISNDSRWAGYYLSPSVEEAEKLRKESKPVRRELVLLELGTGEKRTWKNVTSFSFAKSSLALVIKKNKEEGSKAGGSDLILRYLDRGQNLLLGSVSQHAFDKEGHFLAYTVDTADGDGNGLYLVDLSTGALRALAAEEGEYSRLTWDEKGTAVAILRGEDDKEMEERDNFLVAITGVGTEGQKLFTLDRSKAFGFPNGMVISEKGTVRWAEPPTRVFFGIKEQRKKVVENKDAKPVADIDVWHWQDDRIQSVQMIRAAQDRNRTWNSAFLLAESRFTRLADDSMRSVQVGRDGVWALGSDARKYVSDWEEARADYYIVDVATGERQLALEGHKRTLGLSPDGDCFLYWKNDNIWCCDFDTGEHRNLTANTDQSFLNTEFDRVGEPPPYGVAGWSADRSAIILNAKYDIWAVSLAGGSGFNLTGGLGDAEEVRYRYHRTDPEQRFIDLQAPMLLTTYGQWTKKSGLSRMVDGEISSLMWMDKNVRAPQKARDADRYVFAAETFAEFPDWWVTDSSFENPRRLTDANPQQIEYSWGHRILFDYTNSAGVPLQGTLAIPDSYKEGQKLPMLVNFYEKNSQNLHRYPSPRYASSLQFAGYVSNGYLAMQPDVHFNTGSSHSDMLECVEAAVQKVIDMGYADPARVALHGHSYSGQGSAFIATRSKMFAAVVAGAAATNLVSDFNQLWKSAGTNQHRYDIHGQGRFGTNPFDDLELYQDQSAVYNARTMDTNLLLLHGTADGSVEWLQAVEFYNALRFNGKKVILLSYPGEGHGLRRFENQVDFQRRVRQFLDHHLKGAMAPDWMQRGVPFLEKERKKRG